MGEDLQNRVHLILGYGRAWLKGPLAPLVATVATYVSRQSTDNCQLRQQLY